MNPTHSGVKDATLLAEAFSSFEDASRVLSGAYTRLEDRFRSVNRELGHANRALAQSLVEAETTRRILDGVLAGVPCGILSCDLGGAILTANPALTAMLGRVDRIPPGTSYEEAIGGWEDLARVLASPQRSAARPLVREKTIARADGTSVAVESTVAMLAGADGAPAGIVEIVKDLTELRSLEEAVREARTLAALGEMAASLAHEIRNPLGGIKGFATLLARDLGQDDARLRLLDPMICGIDAINRLVTDFLAFGAPGRPCPRLFDLRALALEVLALAEAEDSGVGRVGAERDLGDAAVLAFADRDHARQALLNLVKNAFEAIPAGGLVRLTVGPGAVLAVRDTGPGIPAEIRERLFRPFRSTKRGGTGLGLAVAKALVDKNGGTLSIETGSGGTTARVAFPAAPEDVDTRGGAS